MAYVSNDGDVVCEQCGNKYNHVGSHWSRGDCKYPEPSTTMKNAVVGLILGDGNVKNRNNKNSVLAVGMITYEFLIWLSIRFAWLSSGVKIDKTAAEKAKITEKSGINGDGYVGKEENFNDYYIFTSVSHPYISTFNEWYESGVKLWDVDVEMSPTTLLMWYVGDGYYDNSGSHRRIIINAHNEMENKEKVNNYFDKRSIPKPSTWSGGYNMTWTVEGSYRLFDYMTRSPWWEGPPPGFEYKFPENFGGTGKDMSDLS